MAGEPAADEYVDPLAGDLSFPGTAGPQRFTPAPAAAPADPNADPLAGDKTLGVEPDLNKLSIELPFWKRQWRSIASAASGEDSMSRPDLPEMTEWGTEGMPAGARAKIGAEYLVAGQDPKALADVAKKNLPGAEISEDTYGNPIVKWNGREAYLNKPGMTAADMWSILGAGVAAAPFSRAASLLSRGTGLLNTAFRAPFQAGAQMAADLVQQGVSRVIGSDQPVDIKRSVEAGVGAGIAEPVAAAAGTVVRPLATAARVGRMAAVDALGRLGVPTGDALGTQWLGTAARQLADDTPLSGNMLNATGRLTLENAGLNLANLPPDMTVGTVRALMDRVPASAANRVAADTPEGRALARNLVGAARFNLPTTAGQAAGNRAMIGREDWLAHSEDPSRSVTPASVMQGFRDNQREAIETAAAGMVPGNAGSRVPPAESRIGQNIAAQGQTQLNRMRAAETAAWDAAGAPTGVGMRLDPDPARRLIFGPNASNRIVTGLSELANQRSLLPARDALDRIARMVSIPAQGEVPGAAVTAEILGQSPSRSGRSGVWQPTSWNQGDLQEARKYITAEMATTSDTGDGPARRAALGQILRVVDGSARASVDAGHVYGNPALMDRFRTAIDTSRARFAAFMPDNDAARGFMDKITTPNVSGQEIVDHLYGGRTGTTEVLAHLDNVFPAGSPMQESLRQGAVQRILGGTREVPTDRSAAAMAAGISKRISEATNPTGNGFEVTSHLLTGPEIAQLQAFRDTLDTIAASGTRNKSGTAYALGDAMRHFASGKSQLFSRWLGDQQRATGEARRAVDQRMPAMPFRPTDMGPGVFRGTVAPTAGAVAGREDLIRQGAGRAAFGVRGLLGGP